MNPLLDSKRDAIMDNLDTTNPLPNSKALTRMGAAEMTLKHLLIGQLPESTQKQERAA